MQKSTFALALTIASAYGQDFTYEGDRGETEEGFPTNGGSYFDNVVKYDGLTGDDEFAPLCTTGGLLNTPDTQGPSDMCCRVYAGEDFTDVHFDFCLYDPIQEVKYWRADSFGWHNEISSYWCGKDVHAQFCAHPSDASATTDMDRVGECATRSGNAQIGFKQTSMGSIRNSSGVLTDMNNKHDSVWVIKGRPSMVYDNIDCSGHSFPVYSDIRQMVGEQNIPAYDTDMGMWQGSQTHYRSTNNIDDMLVDGTAQSVLLLPGHEFEVFPGIHRWTPASPEEDADFQSTSYTIRHAEPGHNTAVCFSFPQVDSWLENHQVRWEDGYSAVHGIKIRELQMPPSMDDGYMLRRRASYSDGLDPNAAVLPKWPLNLWVDYEQLDWKVDDTGAVSPRRQYWYDYWLQPATQQVFNAIDFHPDGLITYEEFYNTILALGLTVSPTEAQQLFADADANSDSYIDVEEFGSIVNLSQFVGVEVGFDQIKAVAQEFSPTVTDAQVNGIVAAFDTNNDTFIDMEEFITGLDNLIRGNTIAP